MSGEVEFSKCDYCGNEDYVNRKYFHYNIKCECHSPKHFEMRRYCKNCFPVEPKVTTLTVSSKVLCCEEHKVEMDECTSCGKETIYPKDLHIDFREYYIEGSGQLCKECYEKIYNKIH